MLWETIETAAVVVLAGYLFVRHLRRTRDWLKPTERGEWAGKTFDVTQLAPKIEGVRRHYLTARQSTRCVCFHRQLLSFARQTVARLEYFHRLESEHQAELPHH